MFTIKSHFCRLCHVERSGDSHEVETSIKMHLYNDNHIDSSTALRSAQNDIINWTVAKRLGLVERAFIVYTILKHING